jgi:hypothetical protein
MRAAADEPKDDEPICSLHELRCGCRAFGFCPAGQPFKRCVS